LVFSNGFIAIRNTPAPGLDWLFATGLSSVMADESGSSRNPIKGPPSTSPSPDTIRDPARPPLNLLVVEDNLPDALIIKEAIRKESLPVKVQIVPDGERALELILAADKDDQAECPQALLLDLNLPKVDGFEVLRALRGSTRFRNLPVLVVTSSDSPGDRSEVAKLGASYFRKPVTYTDFVKIGKFVKSFLQEHQLL